MNTRATQSRGQKTVKVRLSCGDEACSVLAQGVVTLKTRGVARRFKLLSAGTSDLSGETTLRLAIPLRAYRAIRALGSDGTVTVKVRVTASDRFANAASARQSIQLKREDCPLRLTRLEARPPWRASRVSSPRDRQHLTMLFARRGQAELEEVLMEPHADNEIWPPNRKLGRE